MMTASSYAGTLRRPTSGAQERLTRPAGVPNPPQVDRLLRSVVLDDGGAGNPREGAARCPVVTSGNTRVAATVGAERGTWVTMAAVLVSVRPREGGSHVADAEVPGAAGKRRCARAALGAAPEGWMPPSWDDVVREHSGRVYRLAYRLTGNSHDAEDLTQDVFVRCPVPVLPHPGTFEGWLHRITTQPVPRRGAPQAAHPLRRPAG